MCANYLTHFRIHLRERRARRSLLTLVKQKATRLLVARLPPHSDERWRSSGELIACRPAFTADHRQGRPARRHANAATQLIRIREVSVGFHHFAPRSYD